jgi:hypothetical protein
MLKNEQGSPRSRQRANPQGDTQISRMRNVVPQSNSIRIYVDKRIVGIVRDGEFIKRVKASIHFLHTPQEAIAFDISSLLEAIQHGAISVKVIDVESDNVYCAFISTIWDKGFEFDLGWGQQIGLALTYWSQGDEPLGEQLRMWG